MGVKFLGYSSRSTSGSSFRLMVYMSRLNFCYSLESDCVFCMPSHRGGKLGTPSRNFCVRNIKMKLGFRSISKFVFRLPPSEEGEWWELGDDSRGGLPYYYQTKTGETVWERPGGFVIPLSILQVLDRNILFSVSCILRSSEQFHGSSFITIYF